jgi:hypothetical protein
MKIDGAYIAKKIYPFALYIYYLIAIVNMFSLATMYINKCSTLIRLNGLIIFSITVLMASSVITFVFYFELNRGQGILRLFKKSAEEDDRIKSFTKAWFFILSCFGLVFFLFASMSIAAVHRGF